MKQVVAVVDWDDASGQEGPVPKHEFHYLKKLRSFGLLVAETDNIISIAQDFCPEDEDYREILHIPKAIVTKIQRLPVKG